jgi:hypothetical protein
MPNPMDKPAPIEALVESAIADSGTFIPVKVPALANPNKRAPYGMGVDAAKVVV